MRRFTKFTLFLAMLIAMSSNAFADIPQQEVDSYNNIFIGRENGMYDETASDGIAVGDGNRVANSGSNALGYQNQATGDQSTSIGRENSAAGASATSVGNGNSAAGMASSAFGYMNSAKSDYSTVVGYMNNFDGITGPKTNGTKSTAVGYSNDTYGDNSNAFGYYNTVLASNSTAIGCYNLAGDEYASEPQNYITALGYENIAKAKNSNAVGKNNTIENGGVDSNAFGSNNLIWADNSNTFGLSNVVMAQYGNAFGNGNNVQGDYGNGFGYLNKVNCSKGSAFGYGNQVGDDYCSYGIESTAIGFCNKTIANYGTALGYKNVVGVPEDYGKGEKSSAVGYGNIANGNNSVAFGYQNKAIGANSVAMGFENAANYDNSVAIGYQAVAGEAGTVSFGHSSTDTNFSGVAYGSDLEAKLVHVASGTALTDTVNYGQMQKYVADNAGGSLTPEQTLAVNSGITADKVATYDGYSSFLTTTGITGGGFRITNVADAVDDGDAVNYKQIKNSFVDASFDSTTRKLTLTNVNGSTVDVEIPGGSGSGSDPELESKVAQNTTDISANKTAIEKNTADIATNKTNIAKNTSEIENIKKTQEGLGIVSSKKNDNTFSDGSIAIGSKNESGKDTKVAMTIGSDNVVVGKNSIAIGYAIKGKNNDFIGNTVNGDYSIAVGFGHTITGNNSGAFGDPSDISGHGSYAMGNDNKITGNGSFIVGNNGNVSGANSVAIGNQSVATADNVVSFGHSAGDEKGQEGGTYEEDLNRRLIHVADAQEDNDAVNYGQMKDYVTANAGNSGEVIKLRNDLNKMDSRVSKVGASAGALAALKPMEFDPDNKWSAGVGTATI